MKPVLSSLLLAVSCLVADAENWPQFRGPTGQGISTEKNLPLHWGSDSNVVWKTAIPGEGWSSPVVLGDRVFVTATTQNGVKCHVICLDRKTGAIEWNKEVFELVPLRKESKNSYATPTPVSDGKSVFAVFGDGSIVALSNEGSVLWTNRAYKFYSQHGLGASPLLHENLLIMPYDGSSQGDDKELGWKKPWDQAYIVGLDKTSGKEVWKGRREKSRIAHISPLLHRTDKGVQLVSGAGDAMQGFNPKTGEKLWSVYTQGEGVVPSPVIGDEKVFASSGFEKPTLRAIKLDGSAEIVWSQTKGVPTQPSLLYTDKHLFAITDGGVATCYKSADGEIVWQERVGGNHSSSPILADGRIYFLSEGGETTVIEAAPQFKILAKSALGEKCQASFAASQGNLFIRTEKNLYCIGAK